MWAIRGCAKKEARNAHAYGSLLNSLYFRIVSWFFKQPSVSNKKKTGCQDGKRRNEIQCLQENLEETREKQPASSDFVGNKRCAVRKETFLKFRVNQRIMKADEVRDETRRFVSGVLCYVSGVKFAIPCGNTHMSSHLFPLFNPPFQLTAFNKYNYKCYTVIVTANNPTVSHNRNSHFYTNSKLYSI